MAEENLKEYFARLTTTKIAGRWTSEDSSTQGITKIEIRLDGGTVSVHMWGKCHPTDCDWGETIAEGTKAGTGILSVKWTFSHAEATQQIALLPDGRLRVVGHTHFTDNSGRPDMDYTYYFVKGADTHAKSLGKYPTARQIDEEVKSALRNAATAEEAFFASGAFRYTTRVEDLRGYNPTPGVVLSVDYADATRFVLTASKRGGTTPSWHYDSLTGVIAPGFGTGKAITRRAPPAPPGAQHSNLRSLESRIRSEMIFENRLREPVLVFWVNYQGQEVLYRELNPRQSHSIPSFVTHPWRVRIKRTHQPVKEVVANSQREVVVIE